MAHIAPGISTGFARAVRGAVTAELLLIAADIGAIILHSQATLDMPALLAASCGPCCSATCSTPWRSSSNPGCCAGARWVPGHEPASSGGSRGRGPWIGGRLVEGRGSLSRIELPRPASCSGRPARRTAPTGRRGRRARQDRADASGRAWPGPRSRRASSRSSPGGCTRTPTGSGESTRRTPAARCARCRTRRARARATCARSPARRWRCRAARSPPAPPAGT